LKLRIRKGVDNNCSLVAPRGSLASESRAG
jgi:hypothetical protein